ncbi:MAG: amino acid lyase [Bacteroidales bacterium]|nr:amino acid lyase [Bacteroidales bacterium]
MVSFTCDYSEGAHPQILEALGRTNMSQQPGYGEDEFTASAKAKIRQATGCPEADVFLLVGGTQTNATVIDAMLRGYQGVVAVQTGHIAVHEAGAIEFGGHKVLALSGKDGKMQASTLKAFLDDNLRDEARDHMVFPGMVYISFPTEYGTIYSRAELEGLYALCREYGLPLFVDGARLGYGLASPASDVTLEQLARLCDVFYIGGTKVGALCGEAVVFPRGNAPEHFFTTVKQHGALLAKGRLAGVQFDTLFTGGLYLKISHIAIDMAQRLKAIFTRRVIPFHIDSPTNQQFPILTPDQMASLRGKVAFEVWEYLPDGRAVTRFATSWATTQEQLDALEAVI